MTRSVTTGIIGTGDLGQWLGEQLQELDRAVVEAIADVSERNRREAGEYLGVPEASRYEAYEELLANEQLDAVVVATPHTLHHEMVTAAIDSDLHVFCEKPLTTDLERARDLVRRADENESILMVGYQRHSSPPFKIARDALEGRSLKFVTAEITQDWLDIATGTWRANPDLSGGGQLYDTGSHLIDAVLWVSGMTPHSVSADMVFCDDDERVDIQAVLNVEFENGCVASISVSGDTARVSEHIRFWDEEGGVRIDGKDWDDREVSVVDSDGTIHYPSEDELEQPSRVEPFVDAILNDEKPPATARDALSVTALTEAAYESARTGEKVPVDLENETRAPVAPGRSDE